MMNGNREAGKKVEDQPSRTVSKWVGLVRDGGS